MWWLRSTTVGLRAAVALSLARPAAVQPAERRVALVIGNGQYHYVPQLATLTRDARLITETLKRMGFTLVGGQVQLDLEKPACACMVQDFGNIIHSYSEPYILSPLPVAPVHTSDMVLLPEGLKNLKLVAKRVDLTLTGAYLSPDSGFDSTHNRKCIFNAGMIPNIKENPRNRKTTKRGRKRFFHAVIHALRARVERTLRGKISSSSCFCVLNTCSNDIVA